MNSLASAIAKILKRAQKFWGAPLAHGHAHFSSAWDFMMGLGKLQLLAKFEVAVFICYGNIREFVFKNSDKPKWGNPLFGGKLTLPLDSQTQCFLFNVQLYGATTTAKG